MSSPYLISRVADPLFALTIGFTAAWLRIRREELARWHAAFPELSASFPAQSSLPFMPARPGPSSESYPNSSSNAATTSTSAIASNASPTTDSKATPTPTSSFFNLNFFSSSSSTEDKATPSLATASTITAAEPRNAVQSVELPPELQRPRRQTLDTPSDASRPPGARETLELLRTRIGRLRPGEWEWRAAVKQTERPYGVVDGPERK